MTTSPLEIGNHRPSIAIDLRRAAVELVTRPRWAVPIALALLVLFGVCDYLTGVEVAFTLLYLVPVGISSRTRASGSQPPTFRASSIRSSARRRSEKERGSASRSATASFGITSGLLEVASREEGGTRFAALLPLAQESR